jgi:hypothetical protein
MTEFEEYQQTGMLGSYKPECARVYQTEDGKTVTFFRDTAYWERDGCAVHEREMYVGGRAFHVRSVFDPRPAKTPTDAMLRVIDSDLEKESTSG